ncbi:MAG: glycine cleavage system aminomethyltransferase GcvT [Propionibacteriaceae bacterium]|nr:glycine cleavage system aminomethyltransferase GcvT [Propionibacteriaceae bacterium]
MDELLKSPLHDRHEAAGARFAEFGGWLMPLQYTGIIAEHNACRQGAAVFDVSHLGKVSVTGSGAVDFVNSCLSNDLNRIGAGQAQYTLACNETGGVVDDMIAYRKSDENVFLVPNAANTARVVALLQAAAPASIRIENQHRDFAVLAVQGPNSDAILKALALPVGHDYMGFTVAEFSNAELICCRTGYTGERGYELIVPAEVAGLLWDAILEAGVDFGLVSAGLGARDTLRTEMGYALHGHELSETISGLEARVSWAIGWKKQAFWGKDALLAEKSATAKRQLVGLIATGKAIPRPDMNVVALDSEQPIGVVTSGTFSPSLQKGIALALLDTSTALLPEVGVQVRGRLEKFEISAPPFIPAKVRESAG